MSLGLLAGLPGKLATLLARLTATRAGYLDNLSAGPAAQASTALSNGTWTSARAGYLDLLPALPTAFVRSVQTGFFNGASPSSGSGEDQRYNDVTVTAVLSTAKCLCFWQPAYDNTAVQTVRLTSTTNLRIAAKYSGTTTMSGRWYVIEFY